MISKELIKKIKRIEIKTNKIVEELFYGEYHSIFRGNGMEFEDIREYYEGDDVRSIDWNVTARNDKAFIKKFREERELNLFLLVDMSNSNNFGRKKEKIAEIGAALAFAAVKNSDKVGAMMFTENVEKIIPSKKGKKHALSIIETILNYEPQSKGTNLEEALSVFSNFEKKKSIVFVISDFIDEGYEKRLRAASQKHDIILIRVVEKSEKKIPAGAVFIFEDLETGEEIAVDNASIFGFGGKETDLQKQVKIPSSNLIEINADEDFVKPLMLFFKRRIRLKRS